MAGDAFIWSRGVGSLIIVKLALVVSIIAKPAEKGKTRARDEEDLQRKDLQTEDS